MKEISTLWGSPSLKRITLALLFSSTALIMQATTWYSSASGDPSSLTYWWSNTNGTGSNPTNFTTTGDIFIIQSGQSGTLATNWTFGNSGGASNLTLTVNGTLTINSGITLTLTKKNGGTNAVTVNGSLIFLDPGVNQLLGATAGSAGGSNTLTLSSGATLKTANANGISGATNSSISSSNLTSTLSTGANYEFTGTTQSTSGLPATVNNLTTSGSGTKTLSGATTISGNLNIGASTTFAGGGNTYSVGGTTTVNGTLSITTTTAKTFTGDVTIGTGGTWSETAAAPVTFGGSLANNGAFTASTGVHTFTGAGKTFSGTNPIVIPSVTISGTYTNNGTLTVGTALAGSGTLTQGTNATLNLGGTSTITALSAGTNVNTVNFNGAATQTIPAFNYYNLTISNTNAVTLASSGTIGIAGTFTPNAATNTITGSTVNFNGAAQTIPTFTYNNLSTSGSGTKTLGGAVTVNSDLTIGSSTTLDVSGSNNPLTVKGNWTNNGTFTPQGGTVTLSGSALQTIGGSSTTAFNGLTISNTTAPISVATTADITVAGTMTVSSGSVFSPGAGNTVGGTGTLTGPGTGAGTVQVTRITTTPDFLSQYTIANRTLSNLTVDYAGAGNQTIDALSYSNLKTSTSGTKTAAGNLTIAGDLFVATGSTLDLSTFTADRTTSGGTLTVQDNAELAIGGTNTFPANYTTITLGTTGTPLSTVRYNGTTQTIKALNYGDLTLQNGDKTMPATAMTIARDLNVNTSSFAVTGGGNVTIGRYFKIFSGTFNAGTFTYTVASDFSNSGTFNAGTSTVVLNGTGTQNIKGSTATTFYNLTINNTNASGAGVALAQPTTIATSGTLTLTKGIVTSDATNLLIVSNNAAVSGASDASFVDGPVEKIGNQAFTFPVGKTTGSTGTSATGYNPISISAPANVTDAFTADYKNASATALGAIANPTTPAGLEAVSACQYWDLNRTTGTSNVNVTLNWRANSKCNSSPYINDPSTIVVTHFNGSNWDSYGRDGGTTGNATAGSVTWNNVSTFSPFTIGTTNGNLNPLPVTFVSFTGRKTESGTQLNWTVSGESNVSGYEVERRSGNGQFTKISFVAATGSGSYTFTDASHETGVVFYRLKNVDNNGHFAYSTVLQFSSGSGLFVFPTLVTNTVTVLHDAAPAAALISLSTANGQQVKVQRPQPGATQTVVDLTGLQSGMYLLHWSDGTGHTETVKLVKQ